MATSPIAPILRRNFSFAVTIDAYMDTRDYELLESRIGRVHLRQRLGIEKDREASVFGQGINFFHLENWYSIHGLIRGALRLTALHGRGRRNARKIHLREHLIQLPELPAALDGFTILHLSDLHLDMHEDIPRVLSEAVRDLDYDICVMTGDFRAKTVGPWEPAVDGLARVRANLKEPVYAVLGNHDTIRMVPRMEALGVHVLLNEAVPIERDGQRFHLAGIDDPHYYRADNLDRAAGGIPPDEVSVLLAHSPEIYKHAAHADFNVILCGHTHAGQICLPGGIPLMCNARCPRRFCAGSWRYHDLIGYTSAGCGVSIVDVRLNCPAEVTLHVLKC